MLNTDNKSKIIQGLKWFLNTFLYQCVGVIFIYSIWVAIVYDYSVPFSWHVILSTLGMIPFMLESLIVFSGDNSWSRTLTRQDKYWVHYVLMLIGTILFVVGICLESYRKNYESGIEHFQSLHAVTGLISLILILMAFVCGFTAFNANKLKNYAPPVWFKFIHNILGQFGYIIGWISLIYGFHTNWFAYYTTEGSRIAATIVSIIITIWSVKAAIKSSYYQIKSIIG